MLPGGPAFRLRQQRQTIPRINPQQVNEPITQLLRQTVEEELVTPSPALGSSNLTGLEGGSQLNQVSSAQASF